MSKPWILVIFILTIFACSEGDMDSLNNIDSNEWELVILDSIQLDYLGCVNQGDFRNGQGVFFNFQENKLNEFNSIGRIMNIEKLDRPFYAL
jgi:hypothetical protein